VVDGKRLVPHEIERKSFEIIAKRLDLKKWRPEVRPVVLRVVHATGDCGIARRLRFHPSALKAARVALRSCARVVTDVNMVKAGINSALVGRHKNRVSCAIRHADVAVRARRERTTRAAAAMQKCKRILHGGIAVIGNAPTALFSVLDMIREGIRPALVVGVPVGFVGAAESKRALEKSNVPYITLRGTRGGSSVAVAIMNALLNLAVRR
jgi:precorrin-8X/cobalt-precorrin-8 methylmutase